MELVWLKDDWVIEKGFGKVKQWKYLDIWEEMIGVEKSEELAVRLWLFYKYYKCNF